MSEKKASIKVTKKRATTLPFPKPVERIAYQTKQTHKDGSRGGSRAKVY